MEACGKPLGMLLYCAPRLPYLFLFSLSLSTLAHHADSLSCRFYARVHNYLPPMFSSTPSIVCPTLCSVLALLLRRVLLLLQLNTPSHQKVHPLMLDHVFSLFFSFWRWSCRAITDISAIHTQIIPKDIIRLIHIGSLYCFIIIFGSLAFF